MAAFQERDKIGDQAKSRIVLECNIGFDAFLSIFLELDEYTMRLFGGLTVPTGEAQVARTHEYNINMLL
jgi:hypothetical protein